MRITHWPLTVALIGAVLATGCSSMATRGAAIFDLTGNSKIPKVYPGVWTDCVLITLPVSRPKATIAWPIAAPYGCADLPLSFVFDTALLPTDAGWFRASDNSAPTSTSQPTFSMDKHLRGIPQ